MEQLSPRVTAREPVCQDGRPYITQRSSLMPQLRPKVAPAKKIQKMAVIPNLISRLIAISIKTWKLFLISPEIDKRSESHSACPTLCNPMDYTVHGVLQARILEWVAVSSPGDLPNPGIEPRSPHCRWILYQLRTMSSSKISEN